MAKKKEVDMFYLSPKNQEKLISVMDELGKQGFPTDNRTMTIVLKEMTERGLILKTTPNEIVDVIKKVIPKGGKILRIGENNE